jgi:hypothetical protein
MNIPGFTAEASVGVNAYRSYLAGAQGRDTSNPLVLAGSCTCTDPGCDNPTCTCRCPITDPCDQCDRISNVCAKERCLCTCNGGHISFSPRPPCFFQCTGLR